MSNITLFDQIIQKLNRSIFKKFVKDHKKDNLKLYCGFLKKTIVIFFICFYYLNLV